MSGNIEVYKVQWLLCHQHQFLEVTQVVLNNRGRADCALQLRAKELDMYEDTVKKMKCVLDYCKSIIKTGELSVMFKSLHALLISVHSSVTFCTMICTITWQIGLFHLPYLINHNMLEQFMHF